MLLLAALVALVGLAVAMRRLFFSSPSPVFLKDARRTREPLVEDERLRSARLKNAFSAKKMPEEPMDAIVIGSGIGGLCVAALLARAGKRVVVLEQHDQAGGCCHVFKEKGFEFDTGIHYIGEMQNNTSTKFLLDQITEGQLAWEPLDQQYDTVVIGDPARNPRKYPILAGRKQFADALKKCFPEEAAGIDKYVALLAESRKAMLGFVLLKTFPLWLVKFMVKTGLLGMISSYPKFASQTVAEVINGLVKNQELRAVLMYCFGDYGTLPSDAPFMMHAILMSHFLNGGSYPVGGPSEFVFHIIPVIEKAGGKVFVKANVQEILLDKDGKRAVGVRVEKDDIEIYAPIVISDAGIFNTYKKLLPSAAVPASVPRMLSMVRHGPALITIYVGLRGTAKELSLSKSHVWAFPSGDVEGDLRSFMQHEGDELEQVDTSLMFLSFPSAKDPTWDERFPDKCTAEIVTYAQWEWFEKWLGERVMHRGDEYEARKAALGNKLWEHALELYPQLRGRVEYFNVSSPLTNNYYIAAPRGEIYGVDHDVKRFHPETALATRPETDIQGLYLTGQDVFTGGFAGALFGGLASASAVLGHNLFLELQMAKDKFTKKSKSA